MEITHQNSFENMCNFMCFSVVTDLAGPPSLATMKFKSSELKVLPADSEKVKAVFTLAGADINLKTWFSTLSPHTQKEYHRFILRPGSRNIKQLWRGTMSFITESKGAEAFAGQPHGSLVYSK